MAVDRYNPDEEVYDAVEKRLKQEDRYPWDLIPEVADEFDVDYSEVRKATRKMLVQEKKANIIMVGKYAGKMTLSGRFRSEDKFA